MELNEIRHLLHLLQLEDLTPAQILSSMGGIYLSANAISDQEEAVTIVKAFQAVKTPTLGALIPNTCTIEVKPGEAGVVGVFAPTVNKSYALYAADVTNAGVGSLTVDFGLTDGAGLFVKLASASPSATAINAFDFKREIFFDSSVYPAFRVTTGTVADAVIQIVIGEVVQ